MARPFNWKIGHLRACCVSDASRVQSSRATIDRARVSVKLASCISDFQTSDSSIDCITIEGCQRPNNSSKVSRLVSIGSELHDRQEKGNALTV
jgi:hypothetical protein